LTDPPAAPPHATIETVEHVVRRQMATALGGKRGMLEAAVPTLLFTVTFLLTKQVMLAVAVSVATAVALLVVRLVYRSSPKFVLNALFGIALGWFFVHLSQRSGGDANDRALAFFLPGLIYNSFYSAALALSCLVRWPMVGFMVGSVTGDPVEWHQDRQIVRLCSTLTWVLAAPCLVRLAVQWPIWLSAKHGSLDEERAIAALGILKLAMGWPLQLAALALMVWLLARNRTPIEGTA
jgi:hypothetical protein